MNQSTKICCEKCGVYKAGNTTPPCDSCKCHQECGIYLKYQKELDKIKEMLKTDGLRCSIEECGDVDCAVAAIINKIVKLLLHPRTSLIKEIEGMEKGIMWMQEGSNKNRKGYTDGYNSAIENILNLIKGIK